MSDVRIKIPASGSEQVQQLGEYIAVKTTNIEIDVHIPGVGTMVMKSGDVWRVSEGFEGFSIENYSAIAGDILLAVGYGDYRPGLVVGGVDTINTIVNPIDVNPVLIKTNSFSGFYNKYFPTGASALEIVAPYLNINGILLSNLDVSAGNSVTAAILGKSTQPLGGGGGSSYSDNACRVFGRAASGYVSAKLASHNRIVPPGLGIYVSSTGASMFYFEYEVL